MALSKGVGALNPRAFCPRRRVPGLSSGRRSLHVRRSTSITAVPGFRPGSCSPSRLVSSVLHWSAFGLFPGLLRTPPRTSPALRFGFSSMASYSSLGPTIASPNLPLPPSPEPSPPPFSSAVLPFSVSGPQSVKRLV
jgi:hypothetical protein